MVRSPSYCDIPDKYRGFESLCDMNFTTPTENMDVFVLAGQSNMAGRGGVKEGIWDGLVPEECVHELGSILRLNANFGWETAREPLHSDIDTAKTCGVGPGLVFSAELKRIQEPSSNVIGLVPCAIGGTSISEWRKEGPLYQSMISRTRASLRNNGILKAILWYQGESDTTSAALAEGYTSKFEKFINDVRKDLNLPELPIIQVGVWTGKLSTTKFLEKLREAQRNVSLPAVFYVDACGLELQADQLHLTTESQTKLGIELARKYVQDVLPFC